MRKRKTPSRLAGLIKGARKLLYFNLPQSPPLVNIWEFIQHAFFRKALAFEEGREGGPNSGNLDPIVSNRVDCLRYLIETHRSER